MSFVELLDSILEEIREAGQLRPGLHPQAVRSALMGMLEGMMRDRFLAERLGYPAAFDAQQVEAMLWVTLASCVLPASAAPVVPLPVSGLASGIVTRVLGTGPGSGR